MDSPPSSSIRFRDGDFSILPSPREWHPAIMQIDRSAEHWESLRLTIQGMSQRLRLEHREGEKVILANWDRRGTGRYRVVLLEDDKVIDQRTVTITPEKISEDAYSAMIDELEDELPTSIVIALNKLGGLAGVEFAVEHRGSTLAQEVLRLTRSIEGVSGKRPGLADILITLADAPHKILRMDPIWVRIDQARRPVVSELPRVVSAPNNITAERRPNRVVDGRVEHTYDVAENRLLKLFVRQVTIRLRRVERLVAKSSGQDKLREKLTTLARRFRGARRTAAFLEQVRLPAIPPTNPTMVMLNSPPYRATLEGWLEFNRTHFVRIDLPTLDAPLENLPQLYESWGTLRVIESVLRHTVAAGYQCTKHELVHRSAGDWVVRVLPNGRPAVELKHPSTRHVIKIVPEFRYGRSGTLSSLSFAQRPDVSVHIEDMDGNVNVLLFDPKYKLDSEITTDDEEVDGRPKKVDIDKMHAYRDAIRGFDGKVVVSYAAILYPGAESIEYEGQVGALSAIPGNGKALSEAINGILDRSI